MNNLYKYNPYLEKVVKQTGYESLQSLMLLYLLANYVDPDYLLELGTGYGCSAIFMALGMNKGKVISIDDYRGDTTKDINDPKSNAKLCGVLDRILFLKGDTRDSDYWVDNSISKMNIEMMFMDASHNKADLLMEYTTAKDLLLPDHIIVIDDVFSTDVMDFVVGLIGTFKYEACSVLKIHGGMAILCTNNAKYLEKINRSVEEADHA